MYPRIKQIEHHIVLLCGFLQQPCYLINKETGIPKESTEQIPVSPESIKVYTNKNRDIKHNVH